MKKNVISYLGTVMLVSLLLTSAGCDKDNDEINNDTDLYALSGTASGSQEVPAVSSSGSGTLNGAYDSKTNSLVYNVSWMGLTGAASAAHFHGPAMPGQNAGPVLHISISNSGFSGSSNGTATLTDEQERDLLSGKWYYNIHTPTYPDGEIRAQVVVTQK